MQKPIHRSGAAALIALLGVAVTACSGGSGAPVEELPGGPPTGGGDYSGPPPATADVQAFKINLYDNVRSNNRCGACHGLDTGQSPLFARTDDVNLAYAAANPIVELTSPADSLLVTKVAGGHNCWLSSDNACADILTTWITNWAGAQAVGGREIELEPPPLRDPGQSKSFPADTALFAATVYPLLTGDAGCDGCHATSAPATQSPFFAEPDVQSAYEAAKARINLDDPSRSRFVTRLREEGHNCWTASCTADAAVMEAAIRAFADDVPLTSVDPNLLTSKALTLYEGTIAAGGNRFEAHQIALYEFKAGQGSTAFDTSGVEPAMDLTLTGSVEWFGGWGLAFSGGKAQAASGASSKLREQIVATGEFTIEAWAAPGNVVQEDTRIVSYSAGTTARNFNLGQTMYDYDFFVRTENADANGSPALSTPSAAEILQATLQHVVVTFDPVEGRRIYVNGMLVADMDPAPGGLLNDWDSTYAFVLGNEVSGDRPWNGVLRLVAVHNRVLNEAQIVQNFEAGVGEKFFMLFNVEELAGVPQGYVVFEAAQFDTYAYLFRQPFFISLDSAVTPGNVDLEGVRIAINGAEAPVGQSFARVDAVLGGDAYDPAVGQPLSPLGTVIPLEKGPEADEFFLTFDRIGSFTYSRPAPPVPSPPAPQSPGEVSHAGVRTFDAINAAMAEITGVDPNRANVRATFSTLRESLPAVPQLETVLASHQVAIAQLAIEYCHALIEDTSLRATMFPGFNFGAAPQVAIPGNEWQLFDPLLDRMLGATPLLSQPDRAAVEAELMRLLHGIPGDATRPGLLNTAGVTNDAARTRTLAKGVCSAVLGSAAMLIH